MAEPLLTLAAFLCALSALDAAQEAAPPSDSRRVANAAGAALVAQLLFTLGHWSGTYRRSGAEPGAETRQTLATTFVPFQSETERARALLGIFGRFLVFHLPMFLAFGLLPYLSPVPMLDFQLISLIFAVAGHRVSLLTAARAGPRDAAHRLRPAEALPMAALLSFAAVLRFHDLDYNGEFIDESFYAYGRVLGNTFYFTSDSRLWPMVSSAAYWLGGITGVLATTALCGVLTVLCIYRFARDWSREMAPAEDRPESEPSRDDRPRYVGLAAAFLTAVSSPALVISAIGRHDALAFLTYAFALAQIARATRADRPDAMLLGASALLLSFWIRYAVLACLPLGAMMIVYAMAVRRNAYLEALVPVVSMAVVWTFFDLSHWSAAWHFASRTPYASPAAVVGESLARIPVVLVGGALGFALLLRAALGAGPDRMRRVAAVAIPGLGTLGIIAAHVLLARTTLSLERNLALAVFFGALLAGWFIVEVLRRIPSPAVRYGAAVAVGAAATLHAWPIVAAEKHAWGDPRPVVAAVERALARYRLGPETVLWSTDDNGGKGNVHALVIALRGRAVVDHTSPWKPRFWAEARQQRVALIAGTNRADPHRALAPGTMIEGYVVEQAIDVPHGPDAHVFVRRDLWERTRR